MTAKQKKFITSYEITGDVDKSCVSIGITKRTFYNWCKASEEFRHKVEPTKSIQVRNETRSDLKSTFLTHYKESLNISDSCDRTGVSRGTFYNWVKDDEEFKFNVGSINEGMIDLAESVISKAMTEVNGDGNPTKKAVDTARFILSQRGIKRGWGEKIQTEIILTPYEKAQAVKREAEKVVIDVSIEEMREQLRLMTEEGYVNEEWEEEKRLEEQNFFNGLSESEKKSYRENGGEFAKNKFLESMREH